MLGTTNAVPLKVQAAPLHRIPAGLRDMLRWTRLKSLPDQILHAAENPAFQVFSVFVLALLVLLLWIHKYAIGLPFAEEYFLLPAACKQVPLTFEWLWTPANEHRAPMLRLYLVMVGNLVHWDFRLMHYVNVAFLAVGVFALLQAVRKIRGRCAVEDCFLPLVLLSPSLHDTVILYAYAYTPILGWLCTSLALVASGAIYHSKRACMLYGVLAFAILLGAGPAGQLWFVSLMGVVPFLWIHPDFKRWRYAILLVAAGGLAITWLFFHLMPHISVHEHYHSISWVMTARLALRHAVAWAGYYPLTALWPYLGAVILIPYVYVAIRSSTDLIEIVRRRSLQVLNAPTWMPVAAVGIATFMLCVVIGHTRGPTFLWASRYHCMLVPIAAVVYLLLIQFEAPRVLPKLLAVLMLICTGWSWQMILSGSWTPKNRQPWISVLRNGDFPLCQVAPASMNLLTVPAADQNFLIESWRVLQQQRLSVFHKMPPNNPAIAMHPSTAQIDPSIEQKPDSQAVQNSAMRLRPGVSEGRLTFPINLPVDQEYQVWIRCRTEGEGEFITLRIDGGPPIDVKLRYYRLFSPVRLKDHLALGAGGHTLELTLHGAATWIDFVEVVKNR